MGHLVLITRPEPEANDYKKELQSVGFDCMVSPMLTLKDVDFEAPRLQDYAGVLLTSAQAVSFFVSGMQAAQRTIYCEDIPVYCVGKHTALAAQNYGFMRVVSSEGTGKDLADYVANIEDARGQSFLHVHGRDVAYCIADDLMERGIVVDELVVYEAVQALSFSDDVAAALVEKRIDAVTFFSKRTTQAFMQCVEAQGLQGALSSIKVLSISPSVLECVRIYDWAGMYVSETPDRAGMLRVLKEIYGR